MIKRVPSSVRVLLVAFAAVVISFVGSTFIAERATFGIHDSARAIASNAAPSSAHLGAMRTELRHMEVLLDDLVDRAMAGDRSIDPSAVNTARHVLDLQNRLYQQLPTYSGESTLQTDVDDRAQALNDAVAQTLAAVTHKTPADALELLEHTVKPRADQLDQSIMHLSDFNVRQAAVAANKIDRLTDQSLWTALALDAVSVALTIIAAVLAIRAVRRYQALVEERAQELEQFAARVAHDVMSPLSVIGLALDYVKLTSTVDTRTRSALDRARRSLDRARMMSDGLLGFARAGARPEAGKTAELDHVIHGVVEELQDAAAENGVELTAADVPPGAVRCSEGLLSSLVSNLVRNAIKYIGSGPLRRVEVKVMLTAETARVAVSDTGPGLGPGVGLEIFEPYVQAPATALRPSQGGIGLGLATVKRVAEAHGGSVGVKSSDHGCVFWFDLPRAPSTPKPAAPKMERPEAQLPA